MTVPRTARRKTGGRVSPPPEPHDPPVGAPILNPPLKWAGGKRWLVPRLRELWAPFRDRRLVEPLCGGLAITLGLMPERALLNDRNPHAIHFYQWLKRGLRIDIPMENDERLFYSHRDAFNRLIAAGKAGSKKAAGLFYYLNRTGYNGLCRFNRSGEFNVPFGRYKSIRYKQGPELMDYKAAFAGWEFTDGDFEKIPLAADDFIYADPPYDVPFTRYSKEGFEWGDQERLARWLSRHEGPVALSNQATERIVRLYRSLGFRLEFLEAPRRISCTGDRTPAREVLATRGL